MASSEMHSEDSVKAGEEREDPGDDSYRVAHAKKVISSLLQLSEAAIAKDLERFMPLLFANPFIIFNRGHQIHDPQAERLSRDLLLYLRTTAQPPQDRPGTTPSPNASGDNRRLLAEITNELREGNEDAQQIERRLRSALASSNALQNILRNFDSRHAEGVHGHSSGLFAAVPSAPFADPSGLPQQAPPTVSIPFVASDLPSIVSFRDELYEARRQAIEARAHHYRLERLVDDIQKTLSSIQRNLEARIAAGRSGGLPCSQSWMPQNLAMSVSRVYYHSSDYAEELISSPLKVSGYTVRLSVLCLAADSCVKLLFRAQFCFDSGNDAVQWPFRGAVQLVLHHPRNRASNRVYTVHPSQDIETIMPRNTHNAFFYVAGPISALRLDQSGFWAMETLHLSVKIVPGPDSAAGS